MANRDCDRVWLLVDRATGVVLRREHRRSDFSDLPLTNTYEIVRLPRRSYVVPGSRSRPEGFGGVRPYRIAPLPEGWERRANCRHGYPADEIQPRLVARRKWARTHGQLTRFRKFED